MVKPNPDANKSLSEPSHILEQTDRDAIRDAIDTTNVRITGMSIENPANTAGGLYI